MFGILAHLLSDDRLGRTLDAIAPHLDTITGSIGASVIASFGIGTARLHWDMTSFSLFGAYEHGHQEAFQRPGPAEPRTAISACCRSRPASRSAGMAAYPSSTALMTAMLPR